MNKSVLRGFATCLFACMLFGMMSCSSDNDSDAIEQPAEDTRGINDGGYVVDPSDFLAAKEGTGTIWYNDFEKSWYIDADLDTKEVLNDGGELYFSRSIPARFQTRGLKVRFSGDAYKYHHNVVDGSVTVLCGYDYYYILFKNIEAIE